MECARVRINNRDALPTTLLESLALDLPIVSTQLTGIPEIVGEEAGAIVEPQNVEALASALVTTLEKARQGGFPPGTARGRAERLFDLQKNVRELHRRFRQSAESRGR